jgi:exodeoxyribonuclease VII small subunit
MKQMELFDSQKPEETPAGDSSPDFETTLSQLESIVQELEGEIKLERALSLFEQGMKLSGHCQKFLQSAEQQIEVLKRAADGSVSTTAFSEEPAE